MVVKFLLNALFDKDLFTSRVKKELILCYKVLKLKRIYYTSTLQTGVLWYQALPGVTICVIELYVFNDSPVI